MAVELRQRLGLGQRFAHWHRLAHWQRRAHRHRLALAVVAQHPLEDAALCFFHVLLAHATRRLVLDLLAHAALYLVLGLLARAALWPVGVRGSGVP